MCEFIYYCPHYCAENSGYHFGWDKKNSQMNSITLRSNIFPKNPVIFISAEHTQA